MGVWHHGYNPLLTNGISFADNLSMITGLSVLMLAASVSGTVQFGGKPVKDAVLWLEGAQQSRPGRYTIDQKNKTFIPRILVVGKGSTVSFPNRDDIFHNVFAEFDAKKFDLGMYPRGQTREVKFDKPGVVSILCNIHSQMSAYVVVVDTPYFAKTDQKGNFDLGAVTPGEYDCQVWHESGKRITQRVIVGSGNVKLNLALSR